MAALEVQPPRGPGSRAATLAHRARDAVRRHWLPAVVLVTGVAFSLTQHYAETAYDRMSAEAALGQRARQQTRLFGVALDRQLQDLHSLRMVYAVSPAFDASVFQGALASSRTELRDAGRARWVPRVLAAERQAFEAATHGGRKLRIAERGPDGRLVPAGERPEYFPIASLEPREPYPGALGFDMGSNPERRAAMHAAAESGEPVSTVPLQLATEKKGANSVVVYAPVYHGGRVPASGEARRASLAGFMAVVLRMPSLAAEVPQVLDPLDRYAITDPSAPAGEQLLHASANWTEPTAGNMRGDLRALTTLHFGGRDWDLVFSSPPVAGAGYGSLATGFAATALLCLLILAYQRSVRRHAAAIRDTRSRTQALLDHGPDPVWFKDAALRYEFANEAFSRAMGRPLSEILGRTDFELFPPEEAAVIEQQDRDAIAAAGKPISFEESAVTGLPGRWRQKTKLAVTGADGRLLGVASIAHDITKLKQAQEGFEAALRAAGLRYELATAAAGVSVWRWEIAGDRMEVDGEILRRLGFEEGGFPASAKAWGAYVPESERAAVSQGIARHLRGETGEYDAILPMRDRHGELHRLRVRGGAQRGADGRAIRMLGTIHDVTEAWQADHASRITQRAVEGASEAILRVSADGTILDLNEAAAQLYGYEREALKGRSVMDIAPRATPETLKRDWERRHEVQSRRLEAPGRRRDGTEFDTEVLLTQHDVDGEEFTLAFVRDVTERKRAEREMQERERDLRRAQEAGRVGSYTYDYSSATWSVSEVAGEILGIEPGHPRTAAAFIAMMPEEDRERATRTLRQSLERGVRAENEYRIVRPKDGAVRWIRTVAQTDFSPDGAPLKRTGTLQDVTEQKAAADALRESQQFLEKAQRVGRIGIFSFDYASRVYSASAVTNEIFGVRADEPHDIEAVSALLHPEDRERVLGMMASAPYMGGRFEAEYRIVRKSDGAVRWLRADSENEFGADGTLLKRVGTLQDVTERVLAERALADRERDLRRAQEAGGVGSFTFDYVSGKWTASPVAEGILGIPRAHPRTLAGFLSLIPEQERGRARELLRETMDAGARTTHELRILRPSDGVRRWIRIHAETDFAEGRPLRRTGTVQDITEARLAERRLRENEQRLRLALQASGTGVWERDLATQRYEQSPECEAILGRPLTDLAGFLAGLHPDDIEGCTKIANEGTAAGTPYRLEYRYRAGQEWRWISSVAQPVLDASGKAVRVIGTMRDVTAEKRAMDAVREKERELVRAQEAGRIGTLLIDYESRVWSTSPIGRELLGLDDDAPRTIDEFWRIVAPEDRTHFREALSANMTSGARVETDYRIVRPRDGVVRWIRAIAETDYAADGRPVRRTGTIQDITQRKLAEEALRASERRLRAVIDLVPHSIYARDRQGRYVLANRAIAGYLGLEPDALLGRTNTELGIVGSGIRLGSDADEQVWRTGQPQSVAAATMRAPNGQERIFTAIKVPFSFHGDAMDSVLGVSMDITDLKHTEEKLRQTVALLAATLEATDNGIMVALADGRVVQWNQRLLELLRLAPELMGGAGGASLPEQLPAEAAPADPLHVGAVTLQVRDGRWIERFTQPMMLDGRPSGRVWSYRDVTARERALADAQQREQELEARVRERTEELAIANRELESFSYAVSHDLGAPLRAVTQYASLAAEDHAGEFGAKARGYLERVVAASRNMRAMIDALFELSRHSRAPLTKMPVDLAELVRETWELQTQGLEGRRLELRVQGPMPAQGDPALLRTLLQNLVGNAIKYSRGRDPAVVEFGVREAEGQRAFFVRDNGAGFDTRYADKLFQPFQRLHPAREFEGTGIGLATSRRIVERHGGRIWAEAAEGKGATFWFTLA